MLGSQGDIGGQNRKNLIHWNAYAPDATIFVTAVP